MVKRMSAAATKSKIASLVQEMASLSAEQLEKLLPKVVALRLEKRQLVLPDRESELMKTINRGLSPSKRSTYQRLQQKNRREKLTVSERAKLLALSDELEWLGVARLQALTELA